MLACLQTSSKVVFKVGLQNNKNSSLENELDFFSYNSENTKRASSEQVHISFVEFVLWLATITILLIISCSLIPVNKTPSIKTSSPVPPALTDGRNNNIKVNVPEMLKVKSGTDNDYIADKETLTKAYYLTKEVKRKLIESEIK